MSKCENCIHYSVCEFKRSIDDTLCGHYKDKSLFVEVVRCKDCKHFIPKEDSISYDGRCCVGLRYVEEDDYCKYAEAKLKELENSNGNHN